ncbi:MAG: hypothetical protein ACK5M7_13640 [Draconibacterium sp.]
MEQKNKAQSRRKFIQNGGRLLLLGGLTAVSGYLILNKKISASCSVSPTCKNCGKFSKCELPQVIEFRANYDEHKDSKSQSN